MAFDTSSQAKTLADMTAEERAECVGMWAVVEGVNLAVIAEADETNTCVVTYPQWDGDSTVHFNEVVTPRFDLPRAWTPDGQPVEMVQEYGNGGWDKEDDAPYHWPMRSSVCKEYCAPFDKAPAEYSRWVSKWEPVKREPLRVNGMVNPHV